MKKYKNSFRKRRGIALVSVVVMGAFGIAVSMAMYQLLLNVNRSEMSSTIARDLRNAAEIGADYAIEQLNSSIYNEVACPLDHAVRDVPGNYLAGFPNGAVKVKLRDLTTEEWKLFRENSSIYSVALDHELSGFGDIAAANYKDVPRTNVDINYWRVLEVTATRGAFSRSLKVYLEPRFDKPLGNGPYLTSATTSSFFANPLFANSGFNLAPTSGQLTVKSDADPFVDGGYSKYPLTLQTNKFVNFGKGGNTDLLGDISVSNNRIGAPSSVVLTSGSGSGNQIIEGRVEANSDITTDLTGTPGPEPQASDNILANADKVSNSSNPRVLANDLTPVDSAATNPQVAPAPVPYDNAAVPLPAFSNSTTLSGSYYTSNLNTSQESVSISNPTRIFIQDGASSTAAATVDAQMLLNTTGNPSNLQVYYSGSRAINLNLNADFNGLIYAPNASINLTGSHDFKGALVGNEVNMSTSGTSKITILSSIQSQNGSVEDLPSGPSVSYLTKNGKPLLQGYKPVSWFEINQQVVQ